MVAARVSTSAPFIQMYRLCMRRMILNRRDFSFVGNKHVGRTDLQVRQRAPSVVEGADLGTNPRDGLLISERDHRIDAEGAPDRGDRRDYSDDRGRRGGGGGGETRRARAGGAGR